MSWVVLVVAGFVLIGVAGGMIPLDVARFAGWGALVVGLIGVTGGWAPSGGRK